MPSNVIFVSHCDFHGNSGIHLFSIANVLTDLGHSCAVCVPGQPETVFDQGQPRFQALSYDEAVMHGVSFLNGRAPDLVHAWTPREPVRKTAMSLVRRYNVPYFVHLEDNEMVILLNELPGWSREDLERLPVPALDAMIPCRTNPRRLPGLLAGATGITALIDRLLELKPEHVPGMVFFPGSDADFAKIKGRDAQMRGKLGIMPDELLVVYTGSVHNSNFEEVHSLLDAIGLVNRRGFRVKMVKAGREAYALPELSDPKIARHVIDLGFVPHREVPRLLAAADVLIEPGRSNEFNDYRFPSKLPEYFASGKPVVLPRSNIGLLVKNGEEAMVLEDGDSADIADALQRLAADAELRGRIGQSGRAFALRNLDWTKNIAALPGFYERCLAEARRTPPSTDDESAGPKPDLNLCKKTSFVRRLLPDRWAKRLRSKAKVDQPVDPELLVNSFYKLAFGRFAEPDGLAHHIRELQSGVSPEDLAEQFVRSAEFQARHGSNARVDAQYLVALYRDGLGRQPDPEGLRVWLAEAERGMTRAKVLAGFALSTEALEKTSARFAKVRLDQPTLFGVLWRLRHHKIRFESVIDVGASDGRWSRWLEQVFPDKRCLLIDANKVHVPALEKACKSHPRWSYAFCAVGESKAELYFDDSNPLGGHLSETPLSVHYKPCQVKPIDELADEHQLPGPFLIKLDTHGVEIPILKGAAKTLTQTTALVIEAYNFHLGPTGVPFWELCQFMLGLGFRPIDVFDILHRPLDHALWQFDLVFVRSNLSLFQDHRYSL
jgi:FkbM family methyltransferase